MKLSARGCRVAKFWKSPAGSLLVNNIQRKCDFAQLIAIDSLQSQTVTHCKFVVNDCLFVPRPVAILCLGSPSPFAST